MWQAQTVWGARAWACPWIRVNTWAPSGACWDEGGGWAAWGATTTSRVIYWWPGEHVSLGPIFAAYSQTCMRGRCKNRQTYWYMVSIFFVLFQIALYSHFQNGLGQKGWLKPNPRIKGFECQFSNRLRKELISSSLWNRDTILGITLVLYRVVVFKSKPI